MGTEGNHNGLTVQIK